MIAIGIHLLTTSLVNSQLFNSVAGLRLTLDRSVYLLVQFQLIKTEVCHSPSCCKELL